jgi:uncharacterized protein YukE
MFGVELEALASSAAHVAGQGEDLASAHVASDDRIAAAQSGWVGASAAALHTTTATWSATSRRLLTRVGGHALDLSNDGIDFAAAQDVSAAKLRALGSA